MAETRIRNNSTVRIPDDMMESLNLNPGSRVNLTLDGDRLVIEKVAMAEDPFAAAARGPDTAALDEIQRKQREQKERAKDRFEELMRNPPEVKPEDNPDLWR